VVQALVLSQDSGPSREIMDVGTIAIPEQLATFSADTIRFSVRSGSLREAFDDVFARFPLIRQALFPADQKLNGRCIVSLNGQQLDIRELADFERYQMSGSDAVTVIMAAAGG
jgi:hypothetical protein